MGGDNARGREGRYDNGEGSGRRERTGQVTIEARRSKERHLMVEEESA